MIARYARIRGLYPLEPETPLQQRVPQRLPARGRPEAGVFRRQTVRIERAIGQVLRVDDRLVGRAAVNHVPVAVVVDDGVEDVEDAEAELEVAVAAEPNGLGN